MNRLLALVLLAVLLSPVAARSDTTNNTATAVGDPRLKTFATQKRQQTEELASKLHLPVSPEARDFFRAAEAGDWNEVSNRFEEIDRRLGSSAGSAPLPSLANALFVPIHETFGAYATFRQWDGTMLRKFADGVLGSIPAGSVFFGGTDPGRFVITTVRDVAKSPDIFIITPKFLPPLHRPPGKYSVTEEQLGNSSYPDYLRHIYGERLWLPSTTNLRNAFQQYVSNYESHLHPRGPDEGHVSTNGNGEVEVSSVEGQMNINGLITRMIFDHNKDKREFYVEESYLIFWMYPYMEPHGLILKLNKELMKELDPAVVTQDRKFWNGLTKELLADPRFLGNHAARQTFSKLRDAIGGLYAYRRLTTDAEAAYKQAIELCPTSPEANFRLAQLYLEQNRLDDAVNVLLALQQRDPLNVKITQAVEQLQNMQQIRGTMQQLEQAHAAAPRDVNLVLQLTQAYFKSGQTEKIIPLCVGYLSQTNLSANDMMQIAQLYVSLNQPDRALTVFQTIISLYPQDGQAYYAISLVRSTQGKTNEALDALEKAIQVAPALRDRAKNDPQFNNLHDNPRFQKLIAP